MMADVPHILKCLKSAWINSKGRGFKISEKIRVKYGLPTRDVNLDAVRKLLRFQASNPFLMQSRLKAEDLMNSKFSKMRVQPSEAVFSRHTAAAIRLCIEKYGFDPDFETTAFFIEKTAIWYERMTSRDPKMGFSYNNMDKYRKAVKDITDFVEIIDSTIIGERQTEDGGRAQVQRHIILASTSFLDTVVDLLDNGFGFVLGGRFTSECVENLFSCVRRRTLNPTGIILIYFNLWGF